MSVSVVKLTAARKRGLPATDKATLLARLQRHK